MSSVEERLDKLEQQHKNLDADLHSLAKVCADIKNIALTNQHDIAGLKVNLSALAEATHAGFKRVDEQHNEFVQETRERFDNVDKRFESVDQRFDNVDKRFESVDQRFDNMDKRFDQLELLIRQLHPSS